MLWCGYTVKNTTAEEPQMITLKYNSATVHMDGLAIRTAAGSGDHDSRWSYSACPSLSRASSRFVTAKGEHATAADALKAATALAGSLNKKVCKKCTEAAQAQIEAEAAEQAEAEAAQVTEAPAANVELCASNSNAKGMHYRAVGGQVTLCSYATTSRKPNARQIADNKICPVCAAKVA